MGYGRSWSRYDGYYGGWAPYVPVAQRRAQAAAYAKQLAKKRGRPLAPIKIDGRTIARSFWGKAWCENLEAYSDFANRLPRGRTYVRNGSVIDLEIAKGKITALVSGSEVYELTITIDTVPSKTWQAIRGDCARSIASLIDLLRGRFDRGVMERLTQKEDGLFPKPKEIKMTCSCPDYAGMCKHIAAVMYGIGARLDVSPELLFTLRNVDHLELIGQAVAADNLERAFAGESAESLKADNLGEVFGIELEISGSSPSNGVRPTKARRKNPHPAKPPREGTTKKPAKRAVVSNRTSTVATIVAAKAAKPRTTKQKGAPTAAKARAKTNSSTQTAVTPTPRARRTK